MLENPGFDSETNAPDSNGLSRRTLLTLGALAGAALVLPSLPASAAVAYGDAQSMRFLEEIARIEADFFNRAALSAPADGLSERELNSFSLISRQDAELVRWFKGARRRSGLSAYSSFYTPNQSSSRPMPSYRFGADAFSNRNGLFSMAISLKETAVGAFHGVVGSAHSPELIQAFAALAGVQGRQLAVLRELAGRDPLVAYETSLSRNAVINNLEVYGFNREVLG